MTTMSTAARATITIDDKVVTFEGPQEFVDAQVAKYIGGGVSSNNQANKSSDAQSLDLRTKSVLTENQLGGWPTFAPLFFAKVGSRGLMQRHASLSSSPVLTERQDLASIRRIHRSQAG